MMRHPIPEAILGSHIAVLGKTGSGKTSTEKLAIEQVVDDGFRVCVLDSTKSDWWGITSSASGKQAGLPFKILGGPHGHVPLHSSAGKVIGQLVGSGKLPLSIVDMADFEAGGPQRFFIDFAPALMKSARGVVYLVIEEAHEFAPKERSGIGAENMAIHWAKKLATAGRSKGIRLIVATQRVQALHNAVLGSCETLIAHRLTAPADQGPVIKWLQANTDKETVEKVSGSLALLKTGTAWVCSGEARVFMQIPFPKFRTYDNTATPTSDSEEVQVKTAPVDQDELRELIGEAVKQAEADNPVKLRARIAELERAARTTPQPQIDPKALEDARDDGYKSGLATGYANARAACVDALKDLKPPDWAKMPKPEAKPTVHYPPIATPRPAPRVHTNGDASVSGVQQRILDAVAEMEALCRQAPDRKLVAIMSNYKNVNSAGFSKALSGLSSSGYVAYPNPGTVALTDAGRALANQARSPTTSEEMQSRVIAIMGPTAGRILSNLIEVYPGHMERQDLAARSGYQNINSAGFAKALSRLSSLGFISYPSPRQARAGEVLFP